MRTIISVPLKAQQKLDQKVRELGAKIVIQRNNSSVITAAIISNHSAIEQLLDFQDEVWKSWKQGTL